MELKGLMQLKFSSEGLNTSNDGRQKVTCEYDTSRKAEEHMNMEKRFNSKTLEGVDVITYLMCIYDKKIPLDILKAVCVITETVLS